MAEWVEYYKLEPFGDEWVQFARVVKAIWDTQLSPDDRRPLDQHCPWIIPEEREESDETEEDEPDPQADAKLLAWLAGKGIKVRPIDDGDSY